MYRETTDSEQKWPYLDQNRPNKIFDENLKMFLLYAYYSTTLLRKQEKTDARLSRFIAKQPILSKNGHIWTKMAQKRFVDENLKMLLLYGYYFTTLLRKQEKNNMRLSRFIAKQPILSKNGHIWTKRAQIRFFDKNLNFFLLYAYYSTTLLRKQEKTMRGFQDLSRNNRF